MKCMIKETEMKGTFSNVAKNMKSLKTGDVTR